MKHEESTHQKTLLNWSRTIKHGEGKLHDYLIAIPNGAHLAGTKMQRQRKMAVMKAEGLKVGTPDLFLAIPVGKKGGLWIEMKSEKGKPSDNQIMMIDRLQKVRYECVIAYGWVEAKEAIEKYLDK